MAASKPRVALWAVALTFWLLSMPGLAHAATLTVDNTHDTGMGSLRAAILAASSGDTINFDISGTIALKSGLPTIAINLTIDGIGQAITVDGGSMAQIFVVNLGAELTLRNLTITRGTTFFSSNVEGGAILNHGTVAIINSTISKSVAEASGGAIGNVGMLTIVGSTLTGNTVTHEGGAIDNAGTLTIINSTFVGNVAHGDLGGGAIFNGAGQSLKVTNSTFFDNSDPFSSGTGGIDNFFGNAELKGTILADETGGNCGGGSTPRVTDGGYNISDDDSCGFTMAPSGTSINNSTTLHLDPAGLRDNGGPTNTVALEFNSEAVDFIPVEQCTDLDSMALMTDQRGLPRPDFGNPDFCDAGAYELQTMPFVVSPQGERLQIAIASDPAGDQLNTAFTFIENGFPACDAADDAFNGFTVKISSGSCANPGNQAQSIGIDPFAVHRVNGQKYGTFFFADGPVSISARLVELATPAAPACGQWTLNLETTGFDLAHLGSGPFALILSNSEGNEGCFDVTNAIVGSQIVPPKRSVRRGARRR